MNLDDLAELMGKSKEEIKKMLDKDDVIELKLTDKKKGKNSEDNKL